MTFLPVKSQANCRMLVARPLHHRLEHHLTASGLSWLAPHSILEAIFPSAKANLRLANSCGILPGTPRACGAGHMAGDWLRCPRTTSFRKATHSWTTGCQPLPQETVWVDQMGAGSRHQGNPPPDPLPDPISEGAREAQLFSSRHRSIPQTAGRGQPLSQI